MGPSFRNVRAGFVVVFACVTLAIGLSTWRDRSLSLERGMQDARNISTLLGGQIARSLQSIDIVLRDVQTNSRTHIRWARSGSRAANPAAFHSMLLLARGHLPQAFQIAVADDHGQLVASTAGWPTRHINVADRQYFNELAANDDDRLSISLPIDNRATGDPTIVLARRISGEEGRFLGVVFVGVKPSHFEGLYGAIAALPGEVFTLLRTDGTVIIRFPEIGGGAGRKLPANSPFHAVVRAGGGSYRATGALGLAHHWIAVSPLKDYPLVVNIAVPQAALLAGWRERTIMRTIVTGVFLACAIALLSIMTRQMRSLSDSEQALRAYRDRTAAELDAARKMQASLLPSADRQREITARTGLEIASRFATCTELGGDFWGVHDFDDGRVGVYVVDVTGHGTGPAMTTFRLHTLINEMTGMLHEPAQFLTALNRRLTEYLAPGEFATMFYGIIDLRSDRIVYAAAGSPRPIVRPGSHRPLATIDSSGLPLGITAGADYANARMPFGRGAMLFLYSDVFTDHLPEPRGQPTSHAGALELALRCADAPTAEAFVARVCAPFLDRAAVALPDDLTAVCIARP